MKPKLYSISVYHADDEIAVYQHCANPGWTAERQLSFDIKGKAHHILPGAHNCIFIDEEG